MKGIIIGVMTGAGVINNRADVRLIDKVQKIEPISETHKTAYDDRFQKLFDRSKRNLGL